MKRAGRIRIEWKRKNNTVPRTKIGPCKIVKYRVQEVDYECNKRARDEICLRERRLPRQLRFNREVGRIIPCSFRERGGRKKDAKPGHSRRVSANKLAFDFFQMRGARRREGGGGGVHRPISPVASGERA